MKWSDEKLRRCSIDWFSLIPKNIAIEQISYERHLTAFEMRKSGVRMVEIADCFGIGRERAYQMIRVYENRYVIHNRRPPYQKWIETLGYEGLGRKKLKAMNFLIQPFISANVSRDWLFCSSQ
jgi:hypothetical protein